MKLLCLTCCILIHAIFLQAQSTAKNIFIITLDGTRWQEVFNGADEELLRNTSYVKDTGLALQQYWHTDLAERRKMLMPFFWSVIVQKGQLIGNRYFNNNMNVANLYKISYPGYSEIFTGHPDKLFIPNLAVNNTRINILQWLNEQPQYKGKVAAFCSWRILPFILNEENGQLPVNAGYEALNETDSISKLINEVQEKVYGQNNTRHDMLTYECAKNYVEQYHPRVLYIGLGETDEFAHKGEYDSYLRKLQQADAMIAELWYYVQTDPFYKNNTAFIITTDHGRGCQANTWSSHGFWIKGSGETWLAILGAGIEAKGEVKEEQQLYQKQLAATVTSLLGLRFTPKHKTGKPIMLNSSTKTGVNTIAAVVK